MAQESSRQGHLLRASQRIACVREVYEALPFNRLIGLKIDCLEEETAGYAFAMKPDLIGNMVHGILHGGVVSAVLDTTGGMAATASAVTRMPDSPRDKVIQAIARISTIDVRIDYLRPGRGTRFISRGTILRTGNKIAVTRMELINQDHVLIAAGTGAYSLG